MYPTGWMLANLGQALGQLDRVRDQNSSHKMEVIRSGGLPGSDHRSAAAPSLALALGRVRVMSDHALLRLKFDIFFLGGAPMIFGSRVSADG